MGKSAWRAALKMDNGTGILLGFFNSELDAAHVSDTCVRSQFGDLGSSFINFGNGSKDEVEARKANSKILKHWAQCDKCSKWRVLSTEWTQHEFQCFDVLKSCADEEDTENTVPVEHVKTPEDHIKSGTQFVEDSLRKWHSTVSKYDEESKKVTYLENRLAELLENYPPIFNEFRIFLENKLLQCKEVQNKELEDIQSLSVMAKSVIKDPKTFKVKGGLRLNLYEDFDLPFDDFPTYGRRKGILHGPTFTCDAMGAKCRRGFIHLSHNEKCALYLNSKETTAQSAEWLGGIFLGEDLPKDTYLFKYNGVKRRKTYVSVEGMDEDQAFAYAKYRSHTMQSGRYLYDANDTVRYPNGLVNTQPTSTHDYPYTASWGKRKQARQKKALDDSNRNLFLNNDYPKGTLITVNFGRSYNTEGFVHLTCVPNHRRLEYEKLHQKKN